MEYSMILHENIQLFSQILRAASQYLKIRMEFVEKDYWITLILNRLAKSKYSNITVFKGGTSLSKGYNLIERFSEDVDLAITNTEEKTGNKIKTIIREIEKEITSELIEVREEGITSKGSRFRKSLFNYPSINRSSNNRLIVEINSFANPYPFKTVTIQSFLYDFLKQTNNINFIEKYQLQPFKINVLNKEQTLLEKIVSLIRFSFATEPIVYIFSKIRHFYDLYFLVNDDECKKFINSISFKKQFNDIFEHDKKLFDEPEGWQQKDIIDSPLINDFEFIWKRIKSQYKTELSALAYRPIPDEKVVAETFVYLMKKLHK
jgi:predicted nucleotidyltransferase component of viral defense system